MSMVQSVKDLVADAHAQALRARSYIESVEEPVFKTDNGEDVKLNKQSFDQIFMITVTLDEVSVFSPILHKIAKLGIFKSADLPWAVPLFDFRVICEIAEFPSQFVHFLRRRKRLGELGLVCAHDELDYFGHYLSEGLFFEDFSGRENAEVRLLSYTTQFDEYYLAEVGRRSKPTKKPRQQMPSQLRKIVRELEEDQPENYVSVVCALLDLDGSGRRSFVRFLDRTEKAVRKDGKMHDFTITYDYGGDTRGVTVTCGLNVDPAELHQRLITYCVLKKYQQKCGSWIGLGRLVSAPGAFHMHVAVEHPWKYDEELEREASTLL